MEKGGEQHTNNDMPNFLNGAKRLMELDEMEREKMLREDKTMYSKACHCVIPTPSQRRIPNLCPTRREALLYIAERLGKGISCRHIIKRPVQFSSNEEFSSKLAPIAGPTPPVVAPPNHQDNHYVLKKEGTGMLRRFRTVSDISPDTRRVSTGAGHLREERASRRPVRTAQSAPDLDDRARPPRTSVPVHSSHQPHNSRAENHSRATGVSMERHMYGSRTPYTEVGSVNEVRDVTYSRPVSSKTHQSVKFNIGVSGASNVSTRFSSPVRCERSSRYGHGTEPTLEDSSDGKLSPLESGSSDNIDVDFEIETFIPAHKMPQCIQQLGTPILLKKKASSSAKMKHSISELPNTRATILLKPQSLNFSRDRVKTNSGKLPRANPPSGRIESPTLEKLKRARQKLGALTSRSLLSETDEDILCDDITSLPFPPSPTPRYRPKVSIKMRGMKKPSTQFLRLVRDGDTGQPLSSNVPVPVRGIGKLPVDKENLQEVLNTQNTKTGQKSLHNNTHHDTLTKESGIKSLKLVMPVQKRSTQTPGKPRIAVLKSKEMTKDLKPLFENDRALIVKRFAFPPLLPSDKENESGRKSRTLDVNIPTDSMVEDVKETSHSQSSLTDHSPRGDETPSKTHGRCTKEADDGEGGAASEREEHESELIKTPGGASSLPGVEGSTVNEDQTCGADCPFKQETLVMNVNGDLMDENASTSLNWPGDMESRSRDGTPRVEPGGSMSNQTCNVEPNDLLNDRFIPGDATDRIADTETKSELVPEEITVEAIMSSKQGPNSPTSNAECGDGNGSVSVNKMISKTPEVIVSLSKEATTECQESRQVSTNGNCSQVDENVNLEQGYGESNDNAEKHYKNQMLTIPSEDRETNNRPREIVFDERKEKTSKTTESNSSYSNTEIQIPVIESEVLIKRERSKINLNELEFDRSKNAGIMRVAANAGLATEEANDLYYTRDPKILSKVFIDRLVDIAFGSDDETENET